LRVGVGKREQVERRGGERDCLAQITWAVIGKERICNTKARPNGGGKVMREEKEIDSRPEKVKGG